MTASLGRLWAIAALTLLEASRKKVFAILLLFAAALISSTAFFPAVDMNGRLRLIESWSLRAASLFTAIVALFLTGFSLPGDFEQKRVYLVVTKPVSKVTLFLGKYLGFLLLLLIFLGAMGLLSTSFIRLVRRTTGREFPALKAYPRVRAAEFRARNGDAPDETRPGYLPIRADQKGELVWRFHGLKRRNFSENARGLIRLTLASSMDTYRTEGNVRLALQGSSGQEHVQTLNLNTHEEKEFSFPASLIGEDGVLTVTLQSADADGAAAAESEWIVLFERSASFELNFLKGLGLVFLQSALVLTLTLTASTFVSAPLAIILGVLLYLVGSAHTFIQEGTRVIRTELKENVGKGSKHRTPEDIPEWILKSSTTLSGAALEAVPNFDHFDFSRWLLRDYAVSWKDLGTAALYAAPRMLILAALGIVFMLMKDFG